VSPWKRLADRQQERAVKRTAVRLAAARAFARVGFHNVSLDQLAGRLHVTKPTLYYYFENKEQILAECFEHGLAELDRAFAEVERTAASGRDRLVGYLGRYAEITMSDYGICMARVQDSELGPAARGRIKRLKGKVDARIRSLIQEGIDDGSIVVPDVKLAAFAVAGAINWIGHWYSAGGSHRPAEIAALFTDLFVAGLAPRAGAARSARARRSTS
jgi:AcrR family transcriptional regulator